MGLEMAFGFTEQIYSELEEIVIELLRRGQLNLKTSRKTASMDDKKRWNFTGYSRYCIGAAFSKHDSKGYEPFICAWLGVKSV